LVHEPGRPCIRANDAGNRETNLGRIPISEEIYREYPEIQSQFGEPTPWNESTDRFSTIENTPPEYNRYMARRDQFDEEDLQALIKDEHKLACLDAYGQELMNFYEARMFGDAEYLPRNLSSQALLELAFEVCHRIRGGRIVLSVSIRRDHVSAYVPQIKKPGRSEPT